MKDGLPKGTGDSRYLRSVPNFLSQYPTYDAFAQALRDGTMPFDLNGINPAGWAELGTPLNKASLLSDETAAEIGLEQEEPTVNNALFALSQGGGLVAQPTAPDNIKKGWIDTSKGNVLKFYDTEAGAWTPVAAVWG